MINRNTERGANRTSEAIVVSTCPDVCKTPMGNSVVPVPYPLFATFADAENTSPNVNLEGNSAFHDDSYLPSVQGNEAGKLGGVKSGVNKGIVNTEEKSSSVRINGKWAIRNIDQVQMNSPAVNTKGNTIGSVIYCSTGPEGGAAENSTPVKKEEVKLYHFFLNKRFLPLEKLHGKSWGPGNNKNQCASNCQVLCSVVNRDIYYDTPKMRDDTFAGPKVGSDDFFNIWEQEGGGSPVMVARYNNITGKYDNKEKGSNNHTLLVIEYKKSKWKKTCIIGESNYPRELKNPGVDKRAFHIKEIAKKELRSFSVVSSKIPYDKKSKTHIQNILK